VITTESSVDSSALGARHPSLLDLGGEEVKRQGAWRLVGVDVLAIHLAASDEELAHAAEGRSPAERDGDGLRDDIASKRLRRWTGHATFSFARTAPAGRETETRDRQRVAIARGRVLDPPPSSSVVKTNFSIQEHPERA